MYNQFFFWFSEFLSLKYTKKQVPPPKNMIIIGIRMLLPVLDKTPKFYAILALIMVLLRPYEKVFPLSLLPIKYRGFIFLTLNTMFLFNALMAAISCIMAILVCIICFALPYFLMQDQGK